MSDETKCAVCANEIGEKRITVRPETMPEAFALHVCSTPCAVKAYEVTVEQMKAIATEVQRAIG